MVLPNLIGIFWGDNLASWNVGVVGKGEIVWKWGGWRLRITYAGKGDILFVWLLFMDWFKLLWDDEVSNMFLQTFEGELEYGRWIIKYDSQGYGGLFRWSTWNVPSNSNDTPQSKSKGNNNNMHLAELSCLPPNARRQWCGKLTKKSWDRPQKVSWGFPKNTQ